jgi:hypothetical protein
VYWQESTVPAGRRQALAAAGAIKVGDLGFTKRAKVRRHALGRFETSRFEDEDEDAKIEKTRGPDLTRANHTRSPRGHAATGVGDSH